MKHLPVMLARACALWGAVVLATVNAAAQNPAPASGSSARPAATNELDVFMQKVLARREVNRKTLEQYILDETESFEILGPGRWPLYRTKRDYSWYVRDGMHVRSPVRFNGVKIAEDARERYEARWIRRVAAPSFHGMNTKWRPSGRNCGHRCAWSPPAGSSVVTRVAAPPPAVTRKIGARSSGENRMVPSRPQLPP